MEVMGKRAYAHILTLNDVDTVLIDTTTLETLKLEVNPTTGKLKETTTHIP